MIRSLKTDAQLSQISNTADVAVLDFLEDEMKQVCESPRFPPPVRHRCGWRHPERPIACTTALTGHGLPRGQGAMVKSPASSGAAG